MIALGRMIKNDKEVVEGLKSLEHDYNNVQFRDVDYNLLSLKEQIIVDLETDIMIGPHGAGLLHNIFMRDRGRY